jgi:hypothetical protein
MTATLKDVLPQEFFGCEFKDSAAVKHLDCVVSSSHEHGGWQGKHKNVMCWWKLSNGYAVGWNENPSVGWSFPVIKMRKSLK